MISVGSDFSGVGAFDQALMRLGIDYKTVFACDMDKYARQTYIANYGEPEYFPEDVYDREIPEKPLDIYMTSPPCQAFSLAGKRKGEDDDRGILFYNSHEFISKNNPRYFIFENVKGLLSDANGRTFQIWLDMLGGKSVNGNPVLFPREDATPYHIYWKVLNAKDYGVPQNRERVFIIGIRDDADNQFRWPKKQVLQKRLKDVLEDEVDDKYYLSEQSIYNLVEYNKRQIENGNGFTAKFRDVESTIHIDALKVGEGGKDDLIKVKSATTKGYELASEGDSINFSQPNSKTRRGRVGKEVAQTLDTACNQGVIIGALRGRGNNNEQQLELNNTGNSNSITTVQKDNVIVYGNLKGGKWDKTHEQNRRVYDPGGIGATVQTMGGGNQEPKVVQNYKIRRLTPREAFRLMNFPDSFIMPCSNSQMYKQAGNSIVVNVLSEIIKKFYLQM